MFLYISSRTTDLFCGYEDSNTPVNTQKLSAFQVVVFDTRLVLITPTQFEPVLTSPKTAVWTGLFSDKKERPGPKVWS